MDVASLVLNGRMADDVRHELVPQYRARRASREQRCLQILSAQLSLRTETDEDENVHSKHQSATRLLPSKDRCKVCIPCLLKAPKCERRAR